MVRNYDVGGALGTASAPPVAMTAKQPDDSPPKALPIIDVSALFPAGGVEPRQETVRTVASVIGDACRTWGFFIGARRHNRGRTQDSRQHCIAAQCVRSCILLRCGLLAEVGIPWYFYNPKQPDTSCQTTCAPQ